MEVSRRSAIHGAVASTVAMWAAREVRAQPVPAAPALSNIWSIDNIGAGPDAVSWQIGDINGDGRAEIIQLWDTVGKNEPDGRLGGTVYAWDSTARAMKTLWRAGVGQGSSAVGWQIGDVNGDGRDEIIQLWGNNERLGVIVYGWDSISLAVRTLWSTADILQGSGAVGWQIGDVNGDKRAEIIQLWNNGGMLGLIVYGWDSTALAMKTLWSTADIGQGPAALGWWIGDVNGDGRAEIIQLWGNNARLGVILYGWDRTAMAMKTLWRTSDIGQGSGAVGWQIGDVNGDKRAEIIQLWNNGGRLGVNVYGWNSTATAMKTLWKTGDIGQSSGAVGWQIGDVNGDGRDEIIQLRSNNGRLGVIVYGWDSTAMTMKTLWSTGDIGVPSDAAAWLIGKVRGKSEDLVQFFYNNSGTIGVRLCGAI
jgi:hypothetical protein